jgi:L,D-peptidoglycan transpeptidase YkuD (ErfK/YbiS/YcfS/YnhG family)
MRRKMKKKIIFILLILTYIFLTYPNYALGKDKTIALGIKSIIGNNQAIIVSAGSNKTFKVKINAYEKIKGKWVAVFGSIDGVIGKNGLTENKKEKDLKTPVGKFDFGVAFGKYDNPGTKMKYIKTEGSDFWIDDPYSKYYNTFQVSSKKKDWISAEKLLLKSNLYDYAIDIKYNTNPIVKGKGSAIFMHIWKDSGKYTTGCIATDKNSLIKLLKWLNPDKKPIIIVGTNSYIKEITK